MRARDFRRRGFQSPIQYPATWVKDKFSKSAHFSAKTAPQGPHRTGASTLGQNVCGLLLSPPTSPTSPPAPATIYAKTASQDIFTTACGASSTHYPTFIPDVCASSQHWGVSWPPLSPIIREVERVRNQLSLSTEMGHRSRYLIPSRAGHTTAKGITGTGHHHLMKSQGWGKMIERTGKPVEP